MLKTLKILQKTTLKYHEDIFKLKIVNAAPVVGIVSIKQKSRKMKKEFPYLLSKKNRLSLSSKHVIKFLRKHKKDKFYKTFSEEILLISANNSEIIKEKISNQTMGLAQKKYAQYRWFY